MFSEIELSKAEMTLISKLIYDKVGIVLNEKKKSLISGRLQKILREKKLNSFKKYYDLVISDTTGEEMLRLVDVLSTNHTYFFRENEQFQFLSKKLMPELVRYSMSNGRVMRVWSAASSSGEEIYTLKMVFNESISQQLKVKILGTDISTTVLQTAVKGEYFPERMEGISKKLLLKYFDRKKDGVYSFKRNYKSDILFKRLNLKSNTFPFKNKFDIIFCRNVMIYFDTPTKMEIIDKFAKVIRPGGYLLLGMSETIGQSHRAFKYVQPSVYQKL